MWEDIIFDIARCYDTCTNEIRYSNRVVTDKLSHMTMRSLPTSFSIPWTCCMTGNMTSKWPARNNETNGQSIEGLLLSTEFPFQNVTSMHVCMYACMRPRWRDVESPKNGRESNVKVADQPTW